MSKSLDAWNSLVEPSQEVEVVLLEEEGELDEEELDDGELDDEETKDERTKDEGTKVDEPKEAAVQETLPLGTNVSTDRNFTVKAAVPEVLYQLEWHDRGTHKPSFYSSTPFTNLRVVKDTVSTQYQAPGENAVNGEPKPAIQPIIEVVTKMSGTAERDKSRRARGGYGPPPPPPPSNFNIMDEPMVLPKPYKLEEIAIDSFGITRVLIHSDLLLKALRSIITYYPLQNLTDRRNPIAFKHPYMALMHHRDELVEFSKNGNSVYKPSDSQPENDQVEKKPKVDVGKMMEHMKVLLSFYDPIYEAFMKKAGDRLWKINPVARFEEIWYLFPPGTDVYFELEGKIAAGVVIGTEFDSDEDLEVKVWYLAFNGKELKRRSVVAYIRNYGKNEESELTSLEVCPAKVWDIKDGGKRRKAFETRGETVFRLCQGKHKQVYYNGPDEEGEKFKGLVIIDDDPIKNLDFHENADDTSSKASSVTSRTRSSFSRKPRPPPRARKHSPVRGDDPDDESDLSSVTTSSQSAKVIVDKNKNEKDAEKKEAEKKSTFKWAKYNNLTINSPDLTNHHYMLFFPYIMGFAVLIKKWRSFDIDYISEVPRRPDMVDQVVMESAKQNIIKAISHPQNHAWKLDFIQGKGEGQIVLLHGPPGVGKTYTVECAAEATGRPLIFLTIADIGLDEKRIEEQMSKWFSLAERWEAILLIDEADIFLERRRGADIARNGLVSVFLRKMEYFQGLLFLTTNRIGQIDDAFLSRIHVVIGYTPLDESKRKRIWNGFFKKLEHDMKLLSAKTPSTSPNAPPQVRIQVSKYAKEYVLNDEEVKELKWNGREIRNAFQTAISLAGFEASKEEGWGEEGKPRVVDVQKDHFVSVVNMSKEFHNYMDSITLQEEGERARGRLERNDAYSADPNGGVF